MQFEGWERMLGLLVFFGRYGGGWLDHHVFTGQFQRGVMFYDLRTKCRTKSSILTRFLQSSKNISIKHDSMIFLRNARNSKQNAMPKNKQPLNPS
jgi:hypothetical protein